MYLFLLSASQAVPGQSCIVYKKESNGIYVGVDTRAIIFTVNTNTKQTEAASMNMCKTDRVNKVSFAVTGYGSDLAIDEAKKTLQEVSSFHDATIQFTSKFAQKLADILETERRVKPAQYKKRYRAGMKLGAALFLYYEQGNLVGRVVSLTLISAPTEQSLISTQNDLIDSIGVAGNALATRNVFTNKDIWKNGAVSGIKKIVSIEKMATPSDLEGVADIFFVSKSNEYEWVQQQQCGRSKEDAKQLE